MRRRKWVWKNDWRGEGTYDWVSNAEKFFRCAFFNYLSYIYLKINGKNYFVMILLLPRTARNVILLEWFCYREYIIESQKINHPMLWENSRLSKGWIYSFIYILRYFTQRRNDIKYARIEFQHLANIIALWQLYSSENRSLFQKDAIKSCRLKFHLRAAS